MRYNSFECFGVEVYCYNEDTFKNELLNIRYCDTLKEAMEYANDRGSAGYTYKFITCDKYGCKIQGL